MGMMVEGRRASNGFKLQERLYAEIASKSVW